MYDGVEAIQGWPKRGKNRGMRSGNISQRVDDQLETRPRDGYQSGRDDERRSVDCPLGRRFVVRRDDEKRGGRSGSESFDLSSPQRRQLSMLFPIILGREFLVKIDDHRRQFPIPRGQETQRSKESRLRVDGGGSGEGMRMQEGIGDDQFQRHAVVGEKVNQ